MKRQGFKKMDFKVFNNYEAMCAQVEAELREVVKTKPDALLCLAAGYSSIGVFHKMEKACRSGFSGYQKCRYIGLDEWAGMKEADDRSMFEFMKRNCFAPLNIPEGQIVFFDGTADADDECARINRYLKENTIDYMMLGLGMNGHLALNEPGDSFDQKAHKVQLDRLTKETYFGADDSIQEGMTLGMQDIAAAKRIVLVVNGKQKAECVAELMNMGRADVRIPASFLMGLAHAEAYADKEAAGIGEEISRIVVQ